VFLEIRQESVSLEVGEESLSLEVGLVQNVSSMKVISGNMQNAKFIAVIKLNLSAKFPKKQ
jgi:hypothetical protein